jgi:uncharacterized membrane protein YphA (DoxX/SURF4 family)
MFTALSLLLAAACLLPGSAKLLGHPKMQRSAAHFGIPWRRYRLIGAAELAAGAGVLIGLWWHPLGVAAAAGMVLLLIGALITHRRALDSAKEMTPALLALAITLAYLAIAHQLSVTRSRGSAPALRCLYDSLFAAAGCGGVSETVQR